MKSYDWVVMLAKRPGLTAGDRWIAALLYHYAGSKGYTNASHEQLARESGLTRRSVQGCIERLMACGIIKSYRHGHKAGNGRPAMVSSYALGWPEGTHAGAPLGHVGDGLSRVVACPSKGSTKEAEASPSAEQLRQTRMVRMLNHGIPVTQDSYDEWAELLASCNGIVGATAVLEHLRDGRVASLGHARGLIASLLASKGGKANA